MTSNNRIAIALIFILALTSISIFGQTPDDTKTRQRTTAPAQDKDKKPKSTANGDRLEPDETSRPASDVPDEAQANRVEQISEEVAIVNSYNNFFHNYRLGPEDVISVIVFNQDRYSRAGIIIPPSGRISLSLIPGGVFVNGKTVDDVAEIIKKKYDEYIIDPQVTVSLDKASSYRYSIVGQIGQPGIRLMNHRMTVTEAIAEAGGVLPNGDKSKVFVLRRQSSGTFAPIAVNVSAIYKGKAPDTTYLAPGDQIIVPGNKWNTLEKIMRLSPIMTFARIFTGVPF